MRSITHVDETISSFDFSVYSIAIVHSIYHSDITDKLLDSAITTLRHYKVGNIYLFETAGAYELIHGCAKVMNEDGLYLDGVIALGCVIKGDTDHDQYINHAVSQQLGNIVINTAIPIGLGLLTVNNVEQAVERAGGIHGNKGEEAAKAVLFALASNFRKL